MSRKVERSFHEQKKLGETSPIRMENPHLSYWVSPSWDKYKADWANPEGKSALQDAGVYVGKKALAREALTCVRIAFAMSEVVSCWLR